MPADVRARPGRWKVWTRTLHIYASLLGLALALFFGCSGFVLNHEDWFDVGQVATTTTEGTLPSELLADRLAVVEALRARFDVTGALTTYEVEEAELRLRFARPGEDTDVVIQRRDGSLSLTRERGGVFAVVGDLHRGKRSGGLGKLLVDATAILLVSISLSGFVLWITLPKRRRLGLAALALTVGLLAVSGAYLLL